MITSRISTSTPHSRQYDCPTRAFTPIYRLSHFSSVAQLCPTLCDPKECSTPGLTTEFRVHCTGGEDNGTLLQYSYLGNPMDGGAWWATVHGVTKNWISPGWSVAQSPLKREPMPQKWGTLQPCPGQCFLSISPAPQTHGAFLSTSAMLCSLQPQVTPPGTQCYNRGVPGAVDLFHFPEVLPGE